MVETRIMSNAATGMEPHQRHTSDMENYILLFAFFVVRGWIRRRQNETEAKERQHQPKRNRKKRGISYLKK